jgi:acyl-CoA hydrolase
MTEIVLPNDTNGLGNMMGGRLMYLMDKCAAVSAQRHSNRACVTAAVDSVEFQSPIYQSEVVVIESWVNRAFRTSMEVELVVMAENPRAQTRRQCNRAFFTFVALDADGAPTPVPPIHPQTDEERARHEQAAKRREVRLVFAGRLRLEETKYVKDDFLDALAGERKTTA